MEVLRSCSGSPHPLVGRRSWLLILIIAVKQHQFLGFWMITTQSNTDVQGKIRRSPAVPAIGQATWYNSWLSSTSTTSGAGTLLTGTRRDPKTLDEHCFISFSQTHELVGERRRYRTQFVLEDICHLHVTLLTDN